MTSVVVCQTPSQFTVEFLLSPSLSLQVSAMVSVLPLLVLLLTEAVTGGRWMLFGGYINVEGDIDVTGLDNVTSVTLDWEAKYNEVSRWCFKERSALPSPLDGATVSLVDTWKFLSSQLGNSSFSSAHHSTAWARVMVCGGADQQYTVSRQCWWYSIPHDTWYSAPPMWKPRYGAVAVELSGPSSGSKFLTILQSNNLTILQTNTRVVRSG